MTTIATSEYSPVVQSFIPLLYVAWADGMLSPSEVSIIQKEIEALPEISNEDKSLLLQWTDPSEWPDDQTFKDWMSLLKDISGDTDYATIDSIVELGLVMAERAGGRDHPRYMKEETRAALRKLEKTLHIPGLAKFRAIHPPVGPKESGHLFDPAKLQSLQDGDNAEVINRLKVLLADPLFQISPLRTKEAYRDRVLDWLTKLAAQGYGALGFPKEYGGEDDIIKYAAVFETLSYFDLSLAVKFGVQFGLFGGSVHQLGTKKHHDLYLKDAGSAKLLGCFAMTETGHGSNVRDLETTATYKPETDTLIINSPSEAAGKEYIGNALHCQIASVFAQLVVDGESQGVHAVLVPIRSENGNLLPGRRVEDNGYKMGLNGVDNGRIWFDHVEVPRTNLLDRFGTITPEGKYQSQIAKPSKRFFTMLGTLVAGRICVAKGALSAAKVSLHIATKYALRRRQFGPDNQQEQLIMDYPSHQKRLIPAIARSYATHFMLDELVKMYALRDESTIREIETLAAGVKAYTTWFATDTIQTCREACGGKGYLWENRFADLKADSDIFTTFEGDNTVLMQLVSKGLLSSFKQEFSDSGFMGSIRYLANQVSDSFLTINPMYKRKTDADHLLDPRFHLHAFRYRERRILFALGSRMREMFKKRITPYDVFIRTQNHMISLAKAFIERKILEHFIQTLDSIEDTDVQEFMERVYQLFALDTIESNKGWYLEHDYVEGVKTKAIRRQVERLCSELRPHVSLLVEGYGIPKSMVSAPIAI